MILTYIIMAHNIKCDHMESESVTANDQLSRLQYRFTVIIATVEWRTVAHVM